MQENMSGCFSLNTVYTAVLVNAYQRARLQLYSSISF